MEGLLITAAELTPQAQSDVFQTAIEAGYTYGIRYWGKVLRVTPEGNAPTPEGNAPIRSMTIRETEAYGYDGHDKPRTKTITGEQLSQAVQKMFADPKGCGLEKGANCLLEDLNGPLADLIIQVAMFGEVIYG